MTLEMDEPTAPEKACPSAGAIEDLNCDDWSF